MNISRVVTGITLSFLTFHTACTAGAASLWLVQHRCNAINVNVIPLLSGRQGQAIHHVAPVFYWVTVPSSLSFSRLFSRNATLSLLSAAATEPQLPTAAVRCRVGVVPVSRGAERRRRSEERERQAGNKWQFRCAQADGGVAGPLCRLTVLTPAARRHHKPHRSAASTQVLIRRRARMT